MQIQIITLIFLGLFAATMVSIGVYSYSKTKTIEGFLLGGRNIGAWVSAFSYGTAYFSAVVFVGYAGKHGWDIGMASMWIGVGNAILGCLLSWLILAKKTRRMTHVISSKTMPEFFEARYKSKRMKILAALVIFIFLVPYSSAVYKGLGTMFNMIFPGISVNYCMLIIAVLTSVYLILGGYLATAYTDFVQGIIMIVGVLAMIFAIVKSDFVGGFSTITTKLYACDPKLVSFWGADSWKFLCVNILLTSFGTWGLPQMISKFYSVKSEKTVKQATVISTGFCLIIGVGAYFVGSLSRIVLNNQLPAGGHDAVIPSVLFTALGGNVFTVIILALILILLLSASMSTLASVVLTSASAISIDLVPEFKKNYTQKNQILTTRILCLIFVALSYVFATLKISIIVNIMSFSWGIVAGCFIGAYVWGVLSKKVTRAGAWAGMISGLLTVAVPTVYITAVSGFPSAVKVAPEMGVAAMTVSMIAVPLVSLFTKKYESDFINEIFKNERM